MKRAHTWMWGAALALGAALGAPAQDALDQLAMIGEEHEKAGNYAEAVKVYEKIMESPTYVNILAIKYNLGWAYYLTGAYEKAIPLFEDLSGVRAPSEAIKAQCLFLLADCHARLAATLDADSPERAKHIEQGIELQTRFLTEHPKNSNRPQALYARGYAYSLGREYAKAEADLTELMKVYPTSPAALDARFLLASVFSEQGIALIRSDEKQKAQPFLEKARALFGGLTQVEGNLLTANDSTLALAETWFGAGLFQESIASFHAVRSKNEVIRSLRTLLAKAETELGGQIGRREDTTAARAAVDRLRSQLRAVTEGPDLMISAYLRIAQAYYELRWFDVCRVVCRHLARFAEGEPAQQAAFILVSSYIIEEAPEPAAREFDVFQQTFGADVPLAERISALIGQLFLRRGTEDDLARALEQFTKSVAEYPGGAAFEEALFLKFSTAYLLSRYDDALASADQYLEQFPKGQFLPNALYYKGMSQAGLGETDAALSNLTAVIERFPKNTETFEAADEVFYQKGVLLAQAERAPEAVTQLAAFSKRFPDSSLRPLALYQLGIAQHAAGEVYTAQATLESAARQFPDHEIAPIALYQVAVMFYDSKDWGRMAKALETLLEAYPNCAQRTDALFWLGYIARQDNAYDDAIDYLTRCVEENPNYQQAPESFLMIALSYKDKADQMGQPMVLSEERRLRYRAELTDAAYAYETLLAYYPDSSQAQEAIPGMARALYDLVRYKQRSSADIEQFYADALARYPDRPTLRAQLSFGLGSFLMLDKQTEKALGVFKQALELAPDAPLSPQLLASYAEALKSDGALADAETIYTRIIDEHADDERALAAARFGMADLKYLEKTPAGDKAAEQLFQEVLKKFPWYEVGKQGLVKLAEIQERNSNYTEAAQSFERVWREEKGTARIAAMLGVVRCQLAQVKAQPQPDNWQAVARAASETATKVIVLFEAFPDYVSEAYWLQGQICEAIGEVGKAKEMYYKLITEYPNYPSARPAAERLQKLGGYTPAAPAAAPAAP